MVWLNTGFVVFVTVLVFWRLFLLVSGRMVLQREKALSVCTCTAQPALNILKRQKLLINHVLHGKTGLKITVLYRDGVKGDILSPLQEILAAGIHPCASEDGRASQVGKRHKWVYLLCYHWQHWNILLPPEISPTSLLFLSLHIFSLYVERKGEEIQLCIHTITLFHTSVSSQSLLS